MAQLWNPGGGARTAMATALAGNTVATNTVNRRSDQGVLKPSILRIIATVGSACTYAIDGSPDGTFYYPLPYSDWTVAGVPGATTSAVYVIGTTGTFWLMIPVNEPWSVLRVTMSSNTAMINQLDIWCY